MSFPVYVITLKDIRQSGPKEQSLLRQQRNVVLLFAIILAVTSHRLFLTFNLPWKNWMLFSQNGYGTAVYM